jgi:hypothetical protein
MSKEETKIMGMPVSNRNLPKFPRLRTPRLASIQSIFKQPRQDSIDRIEYGVDACDGLRVACAELEAPLVWR